MAVGGALGPPWPSPALLRSPPSLRASVSGIKLATAINQSLGLIPLPLQVGAQYIDNKWFVNTKCCAVNDIGKLVQKSSKNQLSVLARLVFGSGKS